jgi:hypothetical protein
MDAINNFLTPTNQTILTTAIISFLTGVIFSYIISNRFRQTPKQLHHPQRISIERRTTSRVESPDSETRSRQRVKRITESEHSDSLPTITIARNDDTKIDTNKHIGTQVDKIDHHTASQPLWMLNELERRQRSDAELKEISKGGQEAISQCTTHELLRLIQMNLLKPSTLEKFVGNEMKSIHVRFVILNYLCI